jgi:DNA repair protein RecO
MLDCLRMQTYRDLAIVLRTIAYEERNRIVTALTEQNGLVTAMAKNSVQSRRFGGTLEVFAASEWLFSKKPGSELCQLTEAHIREPFTGLRNDFQKLSLASVFSEIMLRIAPPYEMCTDLFKLHSNALSVLAHLPQSNPEGMELLLLNAYVAKLLQWSGSQPRLQGCLSCEVPLGSLSPQEELSCRIAEAGWICNSCRGTNTRHVQGQDGPTFHQALLRVSVEAIQDFQMFLGIPMRLVSEKVSIKLGAHKNLFQFLEGLLIYHVPGFDRTPLKSLRFIEHGAISRSSSDVHNPMSRF